MRYSRKRGRSRKSYSRSRRAKRRPMRKRIGYRL